MPRFYDIIYNTNNATKGLIILFFGIMLAALNPDDRDFVTDIFDEYEKQLYHIAFSILKNEHDASDALQETMYKIIKYIDKFTCDDTTDARNKIMIGLRAAIRNTSLRLYKKQQKKNKHEIDFYFESDGEEVTIDVEDETANVDDAVIKNEDCRKVREALLKLSPDLQDAVNLVYNCNFSCIEAAKFLGISDSALRNRLYQARKKLKEALKGDFSEYDEE